MKVNQVPYFPILALLLVHVLLAPFLGAQEERPGPTPEEVAEVVAALEAAHKGGEEAPLVAAANQAALVAHDDVVKSLARLLSVRVTDGETSAVRRATLEALGSIALPSSLKVLHRAFKKDKSLHKDQALCAALVRAIANHEDPSSVPYLIDKLEATASKDALRARILGLARIRTNDSLEALLKLMNRVAGKRRVPQMEDFRLALVVLTGTDQGQDHTAWMQWWNKAKKTFTVAPEPPPLPKTLDQRWRRFWGLGPGEKRGQKREDRGR